MKSGLAEWVQKPSFLQSRNLPQSLGSQATDTGYPVNL